MPSSVLLFQNRSHKTVTYYRLKPKNQLWTIWQILCWKLEGTWIFIIATVAIIFWLLPRNYLAVCNPDSIIIAFLHIVTIIVWLFSYFSAPVEVLILNWYTGLNIKSDTSTAKTYVYSRVYKRFTNQNKINISRYLSYDYENFPSFFLLVNQSQEYSGRRRVNY